MASYNLQTYVAIAAMILLAGILLLTRTDLILSDLPQSTYQNPMVLTANSLIVPTEPFDSKVCDVKKSSGSKGTVLVTGGAGFVGRHFSHRLCTTGWDVVVVDNLVAIGAEPPEKWPDHLKCPKDKLTFYHMDCRHYFDKCNEQFDLIIHLAAVVGGRAVIEGQPLVVADDLSIDAAAFQWLVKTKVKNMVFFSSSAAYPVREQTYAKPAILKEKMIDIGNPAQDLGFPDLSYGWAKLTGEYLSYLARQQYGAKVAVYRPMSGYGEDQANSYPFISILERIMKKEEDFFLWSNATRDFVYIEDIVDCVMHTYNDDRAIGLNLATGVATSFDALATTMGAKIGYKPKVRVKEGMPLGVEFRVGDTTLGKQMGCTFKTSLSEGIDIALKYKRKTMPELAKLADAKMPEPKKAPEVKPPPPPPTPQEGK